MINAALLGGAAVDMTHQDKPSHAGRERTNWELPAARLSVPVAAVVMGLVHLQRSSEGD
jgi:hypothetical protein